ncbi:MAG: histidine kinase [Chitinophagaceae bacterium]|nr:histidine kinase [Chitinophagaceae bacterium]
MKPGTFSRFFLVYLLIVITAFLPRETFAQWNKIDSLEKWIIDNPTIDSQYILTLHRLSYSYIERDVQKAFEYYEKVNTLSNERNFSYGKALAQFNLGLLTSSSANYDAGIQAYLKSIQYADSSNSERLKAMALNNIGDNFYQVNNYEKCREYTSQAIAINKKLSAWRGIALNYELLAQCDIAEKKFDIAKKRLDSGYKYGLIIGDDAVFSIYNNSYGIIESHKGNMEAARKYFDKAMMGALADKRFRSSSNIYRAKAEYLKNISGKQKLIYLDSAYALAIQTRYTRGKSLAAKLLMEYYQKEKRIDSAIRYLNIYRITNDSIFSDNNRRSMIIRESDWRIRSQEIENEKLKQIAAIQKSEIASKNLLLISGWILFGLLATTAFFFYKNQKASRRRQISEYEKKILQVQMESLKAQMNPHFIFNCLNSIENFVIKNDRVSASRYLNKFSALIRMILEGSNSDTIPFEKDFAATKIYVELERLRFNNKFNFTTEIDPRLLDPEFQVPPLFLQPYVENAILHGMGPSERTDLKLSINAFIENDYIHFVVEDNGIGRKQSSKYRMNKNAEHKSMGLRLTQDKLDIYSQRLKTKSEIEIHDLYHDDEPTGTKVVLKIQIGEILKGTLYEAKDHNS